MERELGAVGCCVTVERPKLTRRPGEWGRAAHAELWLSLSPLPFYTPRALSLCYSLLMSVLDEEINKEREKRRERKSERKSEKREEGDNASQHIPSSVSLPLRFKKKARPSALKKVRNRKH